MRQDKRREHFFWSVIIVFVIQLPLLLYNVSSLEGAIAHLVIFLILAVTVAAIYVGLVKTLKLDSQAPMPWYASPVIWLGVPTLLVVLYLLAG